MSEPVCPDPPELDGRAVLRQRWADLAYFHWPYEPAEVQAVLPSGVEVDTIDGAAWVGLIPFVMRDVRIGPTPPVPYLGTFVEVNVRTYVLDPRGRRAVWFFSLDVPRSAIVAVARTVFALPYCWARATHDRVGSRHRYSTRRRWPRGGGEATLAFTVGDALPDDDVDELAHFLSARWALLTRRRERLLYGRVRHQRWPLHRVGDVTIHQDVVEAAGLRAPVGQPHAMYSPGVDVDIAWLESVDRRSEGRDGPA